MLEKLPAVLGEALADVRAGLTATLMHAVDLRHGMGRLVLTSTAFADHAPLPERCTADGEGVSPPLAWAGAPPGHGVHRCVWQAFALAEGDPLPAHPGRDAVRQALVERALASGFLVGTYERPSGRITEGTAPAVVA